MAGYSGYGRGCAISGGGYVGFQERGAVLLPIVGFTFSLTRVGILGVRVRENLLISSSTLPGLGRVSGTTTVNSRTFTPPFPSLVMTEVRVTYLRYTSCYTYHICDIPAQIAAFVQVQLQLTKA